MDETKQEGSRRSDTYVLFTNTGAEEEVLTSLQKYTLLPGERAFCPAVMRIKRFHGVDKEVKSMLYPGYLFLETKDPKDLYLRMRGQQSRSIFKYINMLRTDEYILPIEPEEERVIRELCGDDGVCDVSKGYIAGDKVIITEGPLKHFTGKIRYINRHKKMAVLETKLLNREIDVTVGLEIVRKI